MKQTLSEIIVLIFMYLFPDTVFLRAFSTSFRIFSDEMTSCKPILPKSSSCTWIEAGRSVRRSVRLLGVLEKSVIKLNLGVHVLRATGLANIQIQFSYASTVHKNDNK